MNPNYLDFEQPIAELEAKIEELQLVGNDNNLNIGDEIGKLRDKSTKLTEKIYGHLTPWQIVRVARHPLRPYALDYISRVFTEFDELHGDRHFGDDRAIVGGIARLDGEPVMVIAQEKGRGVQEKVKRNFGMPKPEGYRKALRLMEMAERFKLPIITLIDTPGAYPGIDSEERGISEAIARNLAVMSRLRTPIICWRPFGDAAIQHLFRYLAGRLREYYLEDHRKSTRGCRGDGADFERAGKARHRRSHHRRADGRRASQYRFNR
jgi:acetyl-CoA carboxylase carboxyl transferase subunit alpha